MDRRPGTNDFGWSHLEIILSKFCFLVVTKTYKNSAIFVAVFFVDILRMILYIELIIYYIYNALNSNYNIFSHALIKGADVVKDFVCGGL